MTESNTGKDSAELICEACGEEFFCGANAEKCWCFAVGVKAETLTELREKFQRCLCANCLAAAADCKSEV